MSVCGNHLAALLEFHDIRDIWIMSFDSVIGLDPVPKHCIQGAFCEVALTDDFLITTVVAQHDRDCSLCDEEEDEEETPPVLEFRRIDQPREVLLSCQQFGHITWGSKTKRL